MRRLVIEDSQRLQRSLGDGLRREGFAVDITGDGYEGLRFAETYDDDVRNDTHIARLVDAYDSMIIYPADGQQARMVVGRPLRLRLVVLLMLLVLMWSMTGCGTLANGRGWGQDAFTNMHPSPIAQAAKRALLDVGTLAPAAGAIVFAASGLDDRVADWASEHTPLFGSTNGAQRASDALNITLHLEALATALATPSGPEPEEWMYAKGKGLGGELLALGATLGMTDLLKITTNRTRPDQSDSRSFPSAHASGAFAATTLANRNLDVLRLPAWAKQSLTVGNLTLASAVAWARVEGGSHFPSDVLAGAAIGHFFSAFIYDAVLGLPDTFHINVALFPEQNGGMVELAFGF